MLKLRDAGRVGVIGKHRGVGVFAQLHTRWLAVNVAKYVNTVKSRVGGGGGGGHLDTLRGCKLLRCRSLSTNNDPVQS